MTPELMLTALIAGHFLCDYPLQGDFLSKAKNRVNPIPGVPWYQASGGIHSAGVGTCEGLRKLP